ncbi:MAG: hypothetical protein MUP61_02760 [Burkholderiales bacterium]|nr:hypothetical protein [Burkholderiales bacterium]MCJ7838122.1 hypothetical protein [Burkholderiales bacterium]
MARNADIDLHQQSNLRLIPITRRELLFFDSRDLLQAQRIAGEAMPGLVPHSAGVFQVARPDH